MSRLQYSSLCCFVHESLHPFTAKSTVSMTKEQEKSLLITLSKVLNKIKLWIGELDSNSDIDSDNGDHGHPLIDVSCNSECGTHRSMCHSSASECIFKITNDLVFLLAVDSRYAQHLAGKVLVAISEFVVASESYWEEFVQSLCFYLELIICEVISPSLDPQKRPKHLDCASSTFKFDLQSLLSHARWHSVGAIVLVLRCILKQQKSEDDVQYLEVYLNALGSCLQNIPWDLCNGINIDEPSSNVCGDASDDNHVRQHMSWFEFCGYLVQLFCSVVSQSSLLETVDDSVCNNPAIHEIFNILPKMLTWFLGKPGDCCHHACISQYIRHKILVLMIRLSSLVHLDCEMVASWLHLINKYFQDLLDEPVAQLEADQDDCLVDSPFLPFVDDVEYNGTSQRHLHRRVVFLYLKCGFSLTSMKEGAKKQCLCGDVKSCSKKGFTALYGWLEKHLPADILEDFELYNDRCKRFTKSFLQLYMHEVVLLSPDDMLFEILLQLTYMPFEIAESQVVEKNIFFLVSDIFDPVYLFHLFLSNLHYDHQVLLDYLVSKDIGASCAQYLLRSLRIIFDKWDSFTGSSIYIEGGNQSSSKRRKVKDDPCIQQESATHKNQRTSKQAIHDARDCLLLLKKSIESLHHKDLFPYNPQVLLRRLARFQELCQRP